MSRVKYRYTRWRWRALFTFVDCLGWMLVRLLMTLRLHRRRSEDRDPRTILVVQLDHLGDAILSTGLLRALRMRYPGAWIEILTGPWNQGLFEACPHVQHVHVTHVNRFARGKRTGWIPALLWWGWRLRRRGFDLAIDVRGEFPNALLLWLIGAPRRVGWSSGGGDFLLTDAADYVAGRPEAESRQALLDLLGIAPPPRQAAWIPTFDPGVAARYWIDHELSRLGESGRPLIVVHVGAGMTAKRWPIEHWRELIGRLVVEHHARVVLVGCGDDVMLARRIIGPRAWPGVHDWTGLFSVVRLAALLERATVVIGADSGPAHLAAAVGAPVVALFSGTNDSMQWRPYGPRVTVVRQPVSCAPCHRETCPLADHPCMTDLRPVDVLRAVEAWLPVETVPLPLLAKAA